ncbi:MAG: hypothetical protein INR63_05250 [Actinomycetospora chiangmaiensis]|jgi:hypothetical protein|nr:hypothetical protein [Actinomycetospora chiangmaiensis]
MSIAILFGLFVGAICLGGLSSLLPFGRRGDDDMDQTLAYEDEFFDVGGPVIDLTAELQPPR